MSAPREPAGSLARIRVLDLAGPEGVYCAKLLADLGADVIKVEPPGGDRTRRRGPFFRGEESSETSLYWWHFNTSKRGITLDIERPAGMALLARLLAGADVLVETFPPDYLAQRGLGVEKVRRLNPRLIHTSITPFGQDGPYRHFAGSDLVAAALGGLLYLGGSAERAPRRPGALQAYHAAAGNATVGTLIALCDRDVTGRGQRVEVSMQESVAAGLFLVAQYYHIRGEICRRNGSVALPPELTAMIAPIGSDYARCKDGYVDWFLVGADRLQRLIRWMDEEGLAGELTSAEFQDFFRGQGEAIERNKVLDRGDLGAWVREKTRIVNRQIEAFALTHTKAELFNEGQRRGIPVLPVNDAADLVNNPHLMERGFFVDVWHSEKNCMVRYPGPPYHLSATPPAIGRPAPSVGQHNHDVYVAELGLEEEELAQLASNGVV